MHAVLLFVFWGSLFGVCYTYIGYPLLILIVAKWHAWRSSGKTRLSPITKMELPEITVLITAYNAEQHLIERIENLFACDYPAHKLHVLIASDGSTDETVSIAKGIDDDRVQSLIFTQRRGKAATLIDAVKHVTTPVVVFTDATTRFASESLSRLVRHFEDPHLGLVAGQVTMVDDQGKPSESLYWRMEMMVRRCEAQLGFTLGATGAIYAVRRSMFVAPRRPIINDDLVLPMLVQMTHQCRVRVDPSAVALARTSGGMQAEFSRRCRIGRGVFQSLPVLGDLLRWGNHWQAVAFASHKLLRWICPFLLISVFISNVLLLTNSAYLAVLLVQITAYTMAVYGATASSSGSSPGFPARIARVATSFVVMNAALGVGIVRGCMRPNEVTWNPTARPRWDHSSMSVSGRKDPSNRAA